MPLSKVASSIRRAVTEAVEEVEVVMTGEAGDERPEEAEEVEEVVGVQEGRGVERGSDGRVQQLLPLLTCWEVVLACGSQHS